MINRRSFLGCDDFFLLFFVSVNSPAVGMLEGLVVGCAPWWGAGGLVLSYGFCIFVEIAKIRQNEIHRLCTA